ncbi:MAG: DUF1294 domain-containing protein [Clostridia bacterium]|nr:DUF1294 domain-containing protein [Clostridia bacterium]
MTTILISIEAVMSLCTFIAYAHDKRQAKKGGWRIPEKTLLLLSFLFGAPGAIAAMYLLRHKTLKKKFTLTVPLFLIMQVALLVWLFVK